MTTTEAQEKLNAYATKGLLPGSFLQSILQNNLIAAINKADSESIKIIVPITQWAWNNLPENIWGSKEAIQNHLEKFKSKPTESRQDQKSTTKHTPIPATHNTDAVIIEAKGSGGAGCGFGHPEPQ